MCGIVGYIGPQQAVDFLDRRSAAAGISRLRQQRRRDDRRRRVRDHQDGRPRSTTWPPSCKPQPARGNDRPGPHALGDARPGHRRERASARRRRQVVALVHNGVIENFRELKQQLAERGYYCKTATDTEVIAQLVACELDARIGPGR